MFPSPVDRSRAVIACSLNDDLDAGVTPAHRRNTKSFLASRETIVTYLWPLRTVDGIGIRANTIKSC